MYLRSPRLCAAGLGFKPRVLLAPELVLAPPYQRTAEILLEGQEK